MRRSFNLCASLLLLLTWLWRFPVSAKGLGDYSALHAEIQQPNDLNDPESRLARGEKLLLDCAGIVELELLNGVSDTTAAHILAAKAVLRHSRRPAQSALQEVHGLGVKKATDLARFLDISSPCPLTESTSVLTVATPPSDPPSLTRPAA